MKAVIRINGTQGLQEPVPDEIELVTDGVYCRTESGYEIHYQESEITGLYGTATTVRICPDGISVERSGVLNSRMDFVQGRSCSTLYETPFGSATLGVDTRRIYADMNDEGGELCIDYVVNMEHAVVMKNRLTMNVRPRVGEC